MPVLFNALVLVSLLAYAVLGGVFLIFSDVLMRSFALVPPPAGVEAMQVINREIFRRAFIPVFFAAVALSLLLGAGALLLGAPRSGLILAAALLYLLGCVAVTGLGNVPLNETLATFPDGSAGAQAFWVERYLPDWTRLNTLRTGACLAAAALLALWVGLRLSD